MSILWVFSLWISHSELLIRGSICDEHTDLVDSCEIGVIRDRRLASMDKPNPRSC